MQTSDCGVGAEILLGRWIVLAFAAGGSVAVHWLIGFLMLGAGHPTMGPLAADRSRTTWNVDPPFAQQRTRVLGDHATHGAIAGLHGRE